MFKETGLYYLIAGEWSASFWTGVILSCIGGGALFLAAYVWYTAPARDLRRLREARAREVAVRCSAPTIPLKLTGKVEPGRLPESARRRHFLPEGERLTAQKAAVVAKVILCRRRKCNCGIID